MNIFPVYIPTQLEYVHKFVKIRIFRAVQNGSGEVTLLISGHGELPSRLTIPAEGLVPPEGVSINKEGYFLYQGKKVSLWDEVPVGANPRIIRGKLPYTNMPEIDINL